jgi:hypothetical protein
MTDVCDHVQLFIGKDRISQTFCWGWLQTIFLISASQVAGIIGMSHFTWLFFSLISLCCMWLEVLFGGRGTFRTAMFFSWISLLWGSCYDLAWSIL